QIEARFITREGRRIPILFSRTAIRDEAGEISDILCIAKDMTGYVRQEEQSGTGNPGPVDTLLEGVDHERSD
ncbi:MAG: hypothetical protein OQL28_16435, partial [Sedimenticola sp.]|nr:hypothetical protein [Sedimenticola sp.]